MVCVAEADHHDAWRLESFVRAHSSLSAHTLSAYSSDVRLFAEWVARSGVTAPAAVTRTLVRRYVAYLSTREFARRSIARNRKVKSGHSVVLWPCSSRYQLAQPPLSHTVPSDFFAITSR